MKTIRKTKAFFFSAWLGLAGLAVFTQPLEAARTSTKGICSVKLHQALDGISPPTQQSLQILNDYHEAQMRMSAKLQLEWAKLSKNGLKEGEHYFWLRENGIKDVNTLAGIALTERYLLLKAWHLTRILEENPKWGRIVHRNFKDTVIVTSLKADELNRLINKELKAVLDRDMRSFGTRGASYANVLMNNTSFGYSRSFEGAHLKANGLDINTWRKETFDLRQKIKATWEAQHGRSEKDSHEFIVNIYRLRKKATVRFDATEIQNELRKMEINGRDVRGLSKDIERYFELIQGADMLPPPDAMKPQDIAQIEAWLKSGKDSNEKIQQIISRRPWTQRHALFFKSAYEKQAKTVLAIDIRGFGVESFAIRDAFILDENMHRHDLRKIYENSTKWLDRFFDQLIAEIEKNTGVRVIANFRSGDDALFAFDPSTNADQVKKVTSYLREKRKDIYHAAASKKSNQDSLALIIDLARTGINQFKESEEAKAN